jgi:hypothetical protein
MPVMSASTVFVTTRPCLLFPELDHHAFAGREDQGQNALAVLAAQGQFQAGLHIDGPPDRDAEADFVFGGRLQIAVERRENVATPFLVAAKRSGGLGLIPV